MTPPGIDELRRSLASWSPEPELRLAPFPRPVKVRYLKDFLILLFVPSIVALIVTAPAVLWSGLVKRQIISHWGTPGVGIILRKFQVRRPSKEGGYFEHRLEFSYSSPTGERWVAEVPVGSDSLVAGSQTVAIHSIASYPGWATIDNDLGFRKRENKILFIMLPMGPATSLLILLVGFPTFRRSRHLLRWGRACGAKIAIMEPTPKKVAAIPFFYESDGVVHQGSSGVSQGFRPGDIVTILVDPKNSNSAMIYDRNSFWRIAES